MQVIIKKVFFYTTSLIIILLFAIFCLIICVLIGLLLVFILATIPLIKSYNFKIRENELYWDDSKTIKNTLWWEPMLFSIFFLALIYPSFSTISLYLNGHIEKTKVVSHYNVYLPTIQSVPGYRLTYSRVLLKDDTINAGNPGEFPIGNQVYVLIKDDHKSGLIILGSNETMLLPYILIQGQGTFLFSTLACIYLIIGTFIIWIISIYKQLLSKIRLIWNNKRNYNSWKNSALLILTYITLVPIVLILIKSSYMGINNEIVGSILISIIISSALFLHVDEILFNIVSDIVLGSSKPIIIYSIEIFSLLTKIAVIGTFIWTAIITLIYRQVSFLEAIQGIYEFVMNLL